MAAATQAVGKEALLQPLKMGSRTFAESKYEIYAQMREEAPVCRVKMAGLEIYAVSRYQDCIDIVTDPRLARNRTTATGKSRFPIPLPRSVMAVACGVGVSRGGSTAAPAVAVPPVACARLASKYAACIAACCSCGKLANQAAISSLVWGRPRSMLRRSWLAGS